MGESDSEVPTAVEPEEDDWGDDDDYVAPRWAEWTASRRRILETAGAASWILGTFAALRDPLLASCTANFSEISSARFGTGLWHFAAGLAFAVPFLLVGFFRRNGWSYLAAGILIVAGIAWAVSGLNDWKCTGRPGLP